MFYDYFVANKKSFTNLILDVVDFTRLIVWKSTPRVKYSRIYVDILFSKPTEKHYSGDSSLKLARKECQYKGLKSHCLNVQFSTTIIVSSILVIYMFLWNLRFLIAFTPF